MKLKEFGKIHNLNTEEDWHNYFKNNMMTGQLPVALYSCPICDEIIDNPAEPHVCNIEKALPESEWEHCPCCPDQGWYVEGSTTYVSHDMALDAECPEMEGMIYSEPEQIQCEFCWTNPKSVFYQTNGLWFKRKEHSGGCSRSYDLTF